MASKEKGKEMGRSASYDQFCPFPLCSHHFFQDNFPDSDVIFLYRHCETFINSWSACLTFFLLLLSLDYYSNIFSSFLRFGTI